MAVSMWRMNGLWRRVAGVLVLCALLLSDEVLCQDDSTSGPSETSAAGPAATDGGALAATGAPTVAVVPTSGDSAVSGAPGDTLLSVTILDLVRNADASGSAAVPIVKVSYGPAVSGDADVVKLVLPVVKCVAKENIPESNAVKAVVGTANCEETKNIIQANAAPWCNSDDCNLEIAQDDNNLLVASKDAPLDSLSNALQSGSLKNQLGVTKTEVPPSSSSGSSVFVGILVSGLLAALGITVGYFKCQRRSDAKGVRLAEEAYPVDQENQGNTLVSVAPLNPPPETQEKPSVNGESPEAAKTQPPPPTNGHSTAKTADTEL